MLSVEEAKIVLMKNVGLLPASKMDLAIAVNHILAEDIFSPVDLPPFNQSAMDGYAIKFKDRSKKLKITGEIKAGDKMIAGISGGEAVRIFTGAAVPDRVDCVVMQEKTEMQNGGLLIKNYPIKKNENIRFTGSHINKGDLALKKGVKLNPAAIGFLASLGILKVPVYRKPDIAIIVTGNELKNPGSVLKRGEIYESNSFTLGAVLSEMGIRAKEIYRVRDEKIKLSETIKRALSSVDIIIISGGISVGKYDLVKDCLEENGVQEIFYKVLQKPGKPLFAGKYKGKNNELIFALPGNPAATLVCFYEYVYPAIKKLMGHENYYLPVRKINMLGSVEKKGDRAYFLKGKITEQGVIPLEGQESYMMKSFSEADSLIYLPASRENLPYKKKKQGNEIVEVHLL